MKNKYILVILLVALLTLLCTIRIMEYSLKRRALIAEYCTQKIIPLPVNAKDPSDSIFNRYASTVSGNQFYKFDKLDSECLKFFK